MDTSKRNGSSSARLPLARKMVRFALGLLFLSVAACSSGSRDKATLFGLAREPQADRGRAGEKEKAGAKDQQNEESYNLLVENAFQPAQTVPLSTFALSVDTASYSNIRRFLLDEQRLPPRDAIRLAELVNYFPYTYPEPRDQQPVSFTLNIADCPWNAKHHLVRIGIKGRQLDLSDLPPRNFVFLIDTSGSMNAPNRLPLLKEALGLLVDRLTEKDRVAIVAYAGSAGLVLPPTPGHERAVILGPWTG